MGCVRVRCILVVVCLSLVSVESVTGEDKVAWLTDLDLTKMTCGWGAAVKDRSCTTQELSIAGRKLARGVGTHAESALWVTLDGQAREFTAEVGVDDDNIRGHSGTVDFAVYGDGQELWRSGVLRSGDAARHVQVPLAGVRSLLLLVTDGGDGVSYDHADWAEARIVYGVAAPQAVEMPAEEAVILTPAPPREPRINGPRVYGARPGHPFLYRIPATGQRPMVFGAKNLPAGLELDPQAGILTGTTPARGEYRVIITAKNEHATAERTFKIVSGDTLALTPPMGWNHWYTHYNRITDDLMRQAADAMIASGMADAGYQYVNIDDCWMMAPSTGKRTDTNIIGRTRDDRGDILPNRYFPDMKGLADYIHSKGLKAGLYTSPGPRTCAGYEGALGHEAQDAKRFAEWGYDFLKYDWCSYGRTASEGSPADPNIPAWGKGAPTREGYQYPYRKIGALLREQPRDIVLNLCQYGMGDVWEWGAEVGGHCWRTAGDLGFELNRVFEVALKNAEHRAFSKPGAWNDPDYIQIGYIGSARGLGMPKPCPLTPTEQYSFMSLWCLSAAPLFFSGDMNRLDPFTLNVLCNSEVIEIDQDPLGQCARVVPLKGKTFVMVKDLEDGSKAVGLCNGGPVPSSVGISWADLGVSGPQRVRDLWRQKELGTLVDRLELPVPRRGVALLRLWPAK